MNRKILLSIVMLLVMMLPVAAFAEEPINGDFECENLLNAILKEVGKQPGDDLFKSDFVGRKYLYLYDSNITNISGIENLTGLTSLGLSGNNISDIAPLEGLVGLTYLQLSDNNISDIAPLGGLTGLTSLGLINNNISDIAPLEGLTGLTNLQLYNNNVSDIAPLEGLVGLTSLGLSYNNISDIAPLEGLVGLTDLQLYNNNVSDIAPLGGLTGLTDLQLSDNNISDIAPLGGLTGLTSLGLINNNISDIAPLEGLTGLTYLGLSGNKINLAISLNKEVHEYFLGKGINYYYGPQFPDIPVEGISLNETSLVFTEGDSAEQLTVTITPSDATNQSVNWTSSNEAVAVVVDGLVTPVGVGTATITATTEDGGFTATCEVTVNNKVEPTGTVIIHYTDTEGDSVKSSDTHENVTGTNTYTAPPISGYDGPVADSVTITISVDGETKEHTFVYKKVEEPTPPVEITDFYIIPGTATVDKNSTFQFNAIVEKSDGTEENINNQANWSIQDHQYGTISNNGFVTTTDTTGTTSVFAEYEGMIYTAQLTVEGGAEPPVDPEEPEPRPRRSGGGGSGSRVVEQPTTVNITSDTFLARWPDHEVISKQAEKISGTTREFTVQIPEAIMIEAQEKGLTPRIYYWNEKYEKWVALPSYVDETGTVKALNTGNYEDVWISVFAVKQPVFVDIAQDAWYEPYINTANGLALIEGYPSNANNPYALKREVKPQQNITRAEFVTMVTRALGVLPEDEQRMYDILEPLSTSEIKEVLQQLNCDIPKFAEGTVAAATKANLLPTHMLDDFRPGQAITRIEAAAIISNALLKLPETRTMDMTQFKDFEKMPEWAKDSMIASSVIGGFEDGTVRPENEITRAEATAVIIRMLRELGW